VTSPRSNSASTTPFERIICALDGSMEAWEAAYQGCRIAPHAHVTLVYVLDPIDATTREADYPSWVHESRDAASAMLTKARGELVNVGVSVPIDTTVEEGEIVAALMYVSSSTGQRTLLTIGSGKETKPARVLHLPAPIRGPVPNWVVEAVDCSVLVARCATELERFPTSIVAGVDGSDPSLHACHVAAAIAKQRGCKLLVVTALGGKGPDLRALEDATPHIPIDRIDPNHPADALMQAASEDGLIVVGNRGRHGFRSLGSVSGAVADRSPVSVLVVRQT